MLLPFKKSINQVVNYSPEDFHSIKLTVKREDLLHTDISGNKYRKLRYNLEQALQGGYDTLLTFGGAYSNHIIATAVATHEFGFKSIGIIRADELENQFQWVNSNPTLSRAERYGMHLHFVSRESYRQKENADFMTELKRKFGNVYIIPQGGTNEFAVKGCEEILQTDDAVFDLIGCAIGTGGTISGIINTASSHQKILGFPAVRDTSLPDSIDYYTDNRQNYTLISDYDFGGFAKINETLVRFMNDFKKQTGIPLDPIYTGKMFYGVIDSIKKGIIDHHSEILLIHTGGLQGIAGMNQKLIRKKITTIE